MQATDIVYVHEFFLVFMNHTLFQKLDQKKFQWIIVTILLVMFFLFTLVSARNQTLTYDEDQHYRYGLQILNLDSTRFDDSKMPFSTLNALPGKIATYLPAGEFRTNLEDIRSGRVFTMLFSLIPALVIFLWAKKLYGFLPGLFSMALYTWDPNIIAHSQFVTTDIFAVGMIVLSTYVLWQFSEKRDWRHAVTLAIVLGLSQLSKYTCIFLFPLFAVLLIVRDSPEVFHSVKSRDFQWLRNYLGRMFLYALMIGLVSILIINIGFLFNQTGNPISTYKFRSETFNRIKAHVLSVGDLPVPLPYPYLQGLDDVRSRERTGRGYGNIYLFGQLRKEGFKGYYLVATLYKEPIATQVAFLLAIGVYLYKRKYRNFLKNELFLIGPLLFFTIYFNFFYQAQIGIRYFLVAFPFVYIFIGNIIEDWQPASRVRKAVVIALGVYLLVSVISYFPNYVPYFNEIVSDRRFAYKILADSNLDWGQADGFASDYVTRHPETLIELEQPAAGKILVSANDLVGITSDPETYQWLRDNFIPIGTVAYAYLLYDISPQQIEQILNPIR